MKWSNANKESLHSEMSLAWIGCAYSKADEYFVLFLVSFAVYVVNRKMLSIIAFMRVAAV